MNGSREHDDEWLAACWEAAADANLRQYPHCLTAVHVPEPWEILERGITAYIRHEPNPDDPYDPEYCLARTVQRPWPSASAEKVLELAARERVLDYRARAGALRGRNPKTRAKATAAGQRLQAKAAHAATLMKRYAP